LTATSREPIRSLTAKKEEPIRVIEWPGGETIYDRRKENEP
jgi:hypothetical protein